MTRFFRFSLMLFLILFLSMSAIHALISAYIGGDCVFATYAGSSSYHCMFPYQYIALLSVVSSIFSVLWILFASYRKPAHKYLYLLLMFLSIGVVSAILGGVLWATHEVIVVGDHRGMGWLSFYIFEIRNTLIYGWKILIVSFPMNIAALLLLWGTMELLAKKLLGKD